MVNIWKGKIVSSNGKVAAYVDENNYVDEKTYSKTFRTAVKSEFHVKLI